MTESIAYVSGNKRVVVERVSGLFFWHVPSGFPGHDTHGPDEGLYADGLENALLDASGELLLINDPDFEIDTKR